MNKFFQVSFLFLALSGIVLLSSCTDDPALPDNIAEFESDAQGLGASESQITVNLKLTREADADGTVAVTFVPTGLTYGTDFTTDPAASGNAVTIPLAAGATSASFKIIKTNTTGLQGDEKIVFTIATVADGLVLGTKNTYTLSFSEIIATSATMEVNGGGSTFPNRVFIDLSANRQTAVARASWDLAFASTGDNFRVVLNSANKMLTRSIDKTDLSAVTAADTIGFGAELSLDAIFGAATSVENPADAPAWIYESTQWMDDPKGDLSKTAIASVSATVLENKVYIINRGTGVGVPLGWKKIRVIRNGSNYTLQHADINSPNFTSLEIARNTAEAFAYVSLTSNSAVSVEPPTASWDIAWTALTNTTSFGAAPFAYYFQDVIIQNTIGVSTAQVLTSTVSYEAFVEANLAGITLVNNNQINIGSSWRTTGPPPSPVGTKADRFYVIKDAAGNVYKLMFTALTTNGERGKPQFKFDLVKKG